MEEQPLVTVNILSYNRKDELRNTLSKVFEQDYKNIEVIVVDNASIDGSGEMVKNEFPSVQLIQLEKNIGIAGWNEGFKIAKGEFVLVLDDDSYPDKEIVMKAVEILRSDYQLGILAFNIINLRIYKSETEKFEDKPRFFVGCGALIKKKLINKIGFYNEQYFIYLHELDYSAKCYNAGYRIKYLKDLIVFHNQNILSRGTIDEDPYFSQYRFKNYFISYSIFLIQRFTLKSIIKYLPKWFINRGLISLKYLFFSSYFESLSYLIKNLKPILKDRFVLSIDVQKFYDFGNMPLIDHGFIRKMI